MLPSFGPMVSYDMIGGFVLLHIMIHGCKEVPWIVELTPFCHSDSKLQSQTDIALLYEKKAQFSRKLISRLQFQAWHRVV